MKNRFVITLTCMLPAITAWSFEITSLNADGTLTFSRQAGATAYSIQYTQTPEIETSWTGSGSLITDTGAPSYTTPVDLDTLSFNLIRVRTFAEILAGEVLINAGTFVMGSVTNAGENFPEETPQRINDISAFYIDAFEVSYGLWSQVVSHHGGTYSFSTNATSLGDNYPVYSVNWYDAVKWCNARSEMEGLTPVYYTEAEFTSVYRSGEIVPQVDWSANGYRLPTEAEWEKAARGGTSTRFPWGNSITHLEANYKSETNRYSYDVSSTSGFHPDFKDTDVGPVDAFSPNAGLYNMIGNVREWCWDYHQANYYQNAPMNDPRGPDSSITGNRVLRGGSWVQAAFAARVSYRDQAPPGTINRSIGFRCVRGSP